MCWREAFPCTFAPCVFYCSLCSLCYTWESLQVNQPQVRVWGDVSAQEDFGLSCANFPLSRYRSSCLLRHFTSSTESCLPSIYHTLDSKFPCSAMKIASTKHTCSSIGCKPIHPQHPPTHPALLTRKPMGFTVCLLTAHSHCVIALPLAAPRETSTIIFIFHTPVNPSTPSVILTPHLSENFSPVHTEIKSISFSKLQRP